MNSKAQAISQEQQDILDGLTSEQKHINPKYFYDHRGSKLFEQITELEEYYPTRTELTILHEYAQDIAQYIQKDSLIIEPGAGNCTKIEYLLEALHPSVYVPQDVSEEFLQKSAARLSSRYPWLHVEPIASDFSEPIVLPDKYQNMQKHVFYPGSTIGNFEPDDAVQFLKNMHILVGENGGVILGVDLHKDNDILHAAYNDEEGITAEFNLNTLRHINQILGSEIDITNFKHIALYNPQQQRIEMYLESRAEQECSVLGYTIAFKQGELIHTEHSYKYTLDGIAQLAEKAGFRLQKSWLDDDDLFSVNYLQRITHN
ncbi:L-histidine N(alpha)-methyltransferase [Kangiella aquimarina]|uniref:L-histidine N(Alpha)-methyltransferase n=1 Tax=Kangiella aquimarina TaxID=261965 RepID=A0ABZ0X1S9_9GAMM|nr:L-histidine N(alpha)-methyltransferase [Kangiella aquimarina]WQG84475.1 L-histidine N(alpha)-methyltransferase [Kangiella aquimarina]